MSGFSLTCTAEAVPTKGYLAGFKAALGRTALAILLAGSLSWMDNASAEEPASVALATQTLAPVMRPDGKIHKAAERILADPVFSHKFEELGWQPRKQEKEKEKDELSWWEKLLIKFAELLASGTRGLIYILIFIAAVALLVTLYRYRHFAFGYTARPSATRQPDTLFGLDLRPGSLPDDITGAALAELNAGNATAALSLLYRGTLVALIRHQHIEFRAGDTEDICLRRVEGRVEVQAANYFAQLLDAWKRAAYAETLPDAESTRDLCKHWAQHFAEQGRAT